MITVSREGRVCLPREILTIAQSKSRGILIEVLSDKGKINPLLLRSGPNGCLEAIHLCHAVNEDMACKHLRSAVIYAEQWLNQPLPNNILVDKRWLENEEIYAVKDLTPHLLQRKGVFKKIKMT